MASKKQGTKKDEGKSLKSKNTVKTIDQMTVARQIAEKFGFKLSDILAVIEEIGRASCRERVSPRV